jgi:hypothetical protein
VERSRRVEKRPDGEAQKGTVMMQQSLVQLVVAWTLVGAFIFTVLVTCASLIGLIRFQDEGQQRKMFYVLSVQLVAIGVTYFANVLNYSPRVAADDAVKLNNYEYWKSFHQEGVAEIQKPKRFPDEYRYSFNNKKGQKVEGKIKYYENLNVYVETNRLLRYPAYHYYFRPIGADDNFIYVYDDSRAYALKLPIESGMSFFCGNGAEGPFTEFHPVIAL